MTQPAAELAAELNPDQAQAVAHVEGPLLVFAGAGSGKTRVITYRIANLLAERVPPYRILAVTFTNKAAGELRARLERLAGEEVTQGPLGGHLPLGVRADLAAPPRRGGPWPRLRHLRRLGPEGRDAAPVQGASIDERRIPPRWVLGRIQPKSAKGADPTDVDRESGFDDELRDLFVAYEKMLAQSNAVDFEDLIIKVMRLAEDEKSAAGADLRHRFRYVLVDEFQDTNLIQYRLVRALSAESRNLCVVGDDDQSIYRWRGANIRIIRGFRRDFPDAKIVKLEQNYRSTGNIVAAALGVIATAAGSRAEAAVDRAPPGEAIRVRAVETERGEATFVVTTVKKEIARGDRSCATIAVFYRVHAQSRVLEEAFRNENVPYQIVGGMRFFERAEVKDILAYLRLLDNPRSRRRSPADHQRSGAGHRRQDRGSRAADGRRAIRSAPTTRSPR